MKLRSDRCPLGGVEIPNLDLAGSTPAHRATASPMQELTDPCSVSRGPTPRLPSINLTSMEVTVKNCSKCKRDLPYSAFRKNKTRYDGYQTDCIECRKAYNREWYVKNKGFQHRLSREQMAELESRSGGMCYICKDKPWKEIDHRHDTCHPGKTGCPSCVRGLLCKDCNRRMVSIDNGTLYDEECVRYSRRVETG